MQAYLVIREGSNWTDLFRLVPGQTVTVGRAPTNQIVIKDERCSRAHAEIFSSEGEWIVRDLDSRNGTAVGERLVRGDYKLSPGDIVQIGRSQLAYVHDLNEAFPDSSSILRSRGDGEQTLGVEASDDSSVLIQHEPPTITHRRHHTRFFESAPEEESGISKVSRAAAKLCRLAFELAKTPTLTGLADLALTGLFESTQADTGALLLPPLDFTGEVTEGDLSIIASRSTAEQTYHRVSPFLATTVLREGEAVLARNVVDDSTLGSRDSKGDIDSTSVICAPVRRGKAVFGLLHLYSTDDMRVLEPDDLEFTLAVADTLAVALQNLTRRQELAENLTQARNENQELRERLRVQSEIIGHSQGVQDVMEQIARAAATRATVLIRGESGVGKELVARAVHYSSSRRKSPFVCLNCAALSETLLESELFGHERGAFTGATQRKIGKFESAHQGTLMLDEIGEMSPTIQAKFLRVLEGHPFERVGGSQPVKVDVRVIAATNRDLESAVGEGIFRRDLYFRLRVLEIDVPPLRKRLDDIPDLANYFLKKFNEETGRKIEGFSPAAMDQMLVYRWPGNIRELRNVVERAIVLAQGTQIEVDDLMLSKLPTAGDTKVGAKLVHDEDDFQPMSLAEMERRHIQATLDATGWNKSRTATILGIERSTLDRKIRRYHLINADEKEE